MLSDPPFPFLNIMTSFLKSFGFISLTTVTIKSYECNGIYAGNSYMSLILVETSIFWHHVSDYSRDDAPCIGWCPSWPTP